MVFRGPGFYFYYPQQLPFEHKSHKRSLRRMLGWRLHWNSEAARYINHLSLGQGFTNKQQDAAVVWFWNSLGFLYEWPFFPCHPVISDPLILDRMAFCETILQLAILWMLGLSISYLLVRPLVFAQARLFLFFSELMTPRLPWRFVQHVWTTPAGCFSLGIWGRFCYRENPSSLGNRLLLRALKAFQRPPRLLRSTLDAERDLKVPLIPLVREAYHEMRSSLALGFLDHEMNGWPPLVA